MPVPCEDKKKSCIAETTSEKCVCPTVNFSNAKTAKKKKKTKKNGLPFSMLDHFWG